MRIFTFKRIGNEYNSDYKLKSISLAEGDILPVSPQRGNVCNLEAIRNIVYNGNVVVIQPFKALKPYKF